MNERVTTAGIVEKDGKYLLGCSNTEGSVNNEKWEFIGGKNRLAVLEGDAVCIRRKRANERVERPRGQQQRTEQAKCSVVEQLFQLAQNRGAHTPSPPFSLSWKW